MNLIAQFDGGVLACNFTKSSTPPWVFFVFFKLYKWYEIAQSVTFSHDMCVVVFSFDSFLSTLTGVNTEEKSQHR